MNCTSSPSPKRVNFSSGCFCCILPRITMVKRFGDCYLALNSKLRYQRSKSFPRKRRINKCTTSVKKPNETMNGPFRVPVKRGVKRGVKWDVKRGGKKDEKRDWNAVWLPVGFKRCRNC